MRLKIQYPQSTFFEVTNTVENKIVTALRGMAPNFCHEAEQQGTCQGQQCVRIPLLSAHARICCHATHTVHLLPVLLQTRLSPLTAELAHDHDAVVAFVNDDCSAQVSLAAAAAAPQRRLCCLPPCCDAQYNTAPWCMVHGYAAQHLSWPTYSHPRLKPGSPDAHTCTHSYTYN